MQQLEVETAQPLFIKVLVSTNTRGMEAFSADKKTIVFKYRDQNELQGIEIVQCALVQIGEGRPRPSAEAPRVYPIRTICPKFSPGADPIGSLDTWLAGVSSVCSGLKTARTRSLLSSDPSTQMPSFV